MPLERVEVPEQLVLLVVLVQQDSRDLQARLVPQVRLVTPGQLEALVALGQRDRPEILVQLEPLELMEELE